MKMICFAVLVSAALVSAAGLGFECPLGKSNNNADTTSPSEEACCVDYAPYCYQVTDGGDPFACGTGLYIPGQKMYEYSPSEEVCCSVIPEISEDTATCGEYKYDIVSDGAIPFDECPAGKVLDGEYAAYSLSASAENCCVPFVATCAHITPEDVIYGYHLFDCATGTTFNQTAVSALSPSQDACCETFVPTCTYASGTIFEPEPYVCPAGTINNQATLGPATDELCCNDYTPDCARTNDAGHIFKCPAGKAQVDNFDYVSCEPTEECCCRTPTSCGNVAQATCADIDCADYGGESADYGVSTVAGMGDFAYSSPLAECCLVFLIDDDDYSGASSRMSFGAASIFAVVLTACMMA